MENSPSITTLAIPYLPFLTFGPPRTITDRTGLAMLKYGPTDWIKAIYN